MKLLLLCVLFVVVAFTGAAPLAKTAPKAIPAHTSEENLKRDVVEKVREALSSGEGERALQNILDQTNNNADADAKDVHELGGVTKKSTSREDQLRNLIVKNVKDALQKGEGKAALQELYDESDADNVDANKHDAVPDSDANEGAGLGSKNGVPAAIQNELEQDENTGTQPRGVVPSRDVHEGVMVNDLPNDLDGTGSVLSNEKKSDDIYNGIEDSDDVQNGIEDISPNDGKQSDDIQNGIEDIYPSDGKQSDDLQNGVFYNNAGIEDISSNEGMQSDDIQNGMEDISSNVGMQSDYIQNDIEDISSNVGMQSDYIQNDIEDISSNVGMQSDYTQNGIIYNNADAPNPSVQDISSKDGMQSEEIQNGYIINDNAYFNNPTGSETKTRNVGRSRDGRTTKFESLDAIMNDDSAINQTAAEKQQTAKNTTVEENPPTEESPVAVGGGGGDNNIMGNGYFINTEPRNEVASLDVKGLLAHQDDEAMEAPAAPAASSYHAYSIGESKDVVHVAHGNDINKVNDESNRKDGKEEGAIIVEQNGYWQ